MGFWDLFRTIDTELLEVLARVEGGPHSTAIGSGSGGLVQTSVAGSGFLAPAISDDGPWCILLTFAQETDDGILTTKILSAPDRATVNVTLNAGERVLNLIDLIYVLSLHGGSPGPKISRMTVQHVRDWTRRLVLPELEAAEARLISSRRRQAAEVDAMRKKYL